MKIDPLGKPQAHRDRRPVVLLEPYKGRMIFYTETAKYSLSGRKVDRHLDELEGCDVYCDKPITQLRYATSSPAGWTAHAWRDAVTSMSWGKVRVRPLRGCLEDSEDPYGDLLAFLAWARGRGVQAAGLSTMGWNLWRSTLERPIWLESDPEVTQRAFYGGRQQIRSSGRFRHMTLWDTKMAYPHAMVSELYPTTLREVAGSALVTGGLAEATVTVPQDLPWAPLPSHPDPIKAGIVFWLHGNIEGVWPAGELKAAAELGCHVRVTRSWVPTGYADLFGAWWPLVLEMRALPGGAGDVGKAISNLLWGAFAMDGSHSAWRWTDNRKPPTQVSTEAPRNMPQRWIRHVAAETTSRVRTRLLMEGIYGGPYSPVHIDTDGIIIRSSSPAPGSDCINGSIAHDEQLPVSGNNPGQWRIKETMRTLEVRAPQVYRYTCGRGCAVTHPRWHYVCSGVPEDAAPAWWDKEADTFDLNIDLAVLGGGKVDVNPFAAERAMQAAQALAVRSLTEGPGWQGVRV